MRSLHYTMINIMHAVKKLYIGGLALRRVQTHTDLGPDYKKILRFLLRLSQVRSQAYRKFSTYDIV